MSCQVKSSSLSPDDRPQGTLIAVSRPEAGTICMTYDFGSNSIVTFANEPMVAFDISALVVIS